MKDLSQEAEYLAACAPLSRPFFNHLFEYFVKTAPERNLPYEDYRHSFSTVLTQSRTRIFELMSKQINEKHEPAEKGGMPTEFFLSALQQASVDHTPIQAQTLSPWSKSRLLRKGFNCIEYHSFAEVLLARMIDKRAKGWLPSSVPKGEPHMWVFYQAPPSLYVDNEWVEQPIQVVPYPLSEDIGLVSSGVLWSPWAGLVWDGWIHIEHMGAIRFVGQKLEHGRLLWNLDFSALNRWGIEAENPLGLLAQSDEGYQYLAYRSLLELAMKKFTSDGKNSWRS